MQGLVLKLNMPKAKLMESLGNDIFIFRNAITEDSLNLADEHFSSGKFDDTSIAKNDHYSLESSRPQICFIKEDTQLSKNLADVAREIAQKLEMVYGYLGVDRCTPFRLNEYSKGRGYKTHIDRSSLDNEKKTRAISLVFGINEDYEGGELRFPRQNLSVTVGRGDVIVFPSGYTHPHYVDNVKSGIRKTIVSWMI